VGTVVLLVELLGAAGAACIYRSTHFCVRQNGRSLFAKKRENFIQIRPSLATDGLAPVCTT
jgi:hypothetical protein